MITLYGVLLFLHILGAGVWLGGEAMMFGLRALALRGGDRSRAVALVRDMDRLNVLLILPASAVLLGAGLWLVIEGHWGFVGGVVTTPSGKTLQKTLEMRGADSPEVDSLMRRIQIGLLVDVLILTAIVFVMATKPTV